tara:strand:+ start:63 stop:923 length:861 start_codon:yes stop_codon:yes gene_type:complete
MAVKQKNIFEAIYVAKGFPHLVCALNSIDMLRKHNPNIKISLLSDQINSLSADALSLISSTTDLPKNLDIRSVKTNIFNYSSAQCCVFLDADTEINGSLTDGFKLLEYFDLALRPHPGPLAAGSKDNARVFGGEFSITQLPHWNSGVFFFKRNDKVKNFFKDWSETYFELKNRFDQVSLVESLFRSEIKICPLDFRWNANTVQAEKSPSVIIHHYTSDISKSVQKNLQVALRKYLKAESFTEPELNYWINQKLQDRLARGKSLSRNKFLSRQFKRLKKLKTLSQKF